jgi:hypothetical protein
MSTDRITREGRSIPDRRVGKAPVGSGRAAHDPAMDETAAFLATLDAAAPDAPTACAGWTAHELVAHLAAGAAELAQLTENAVDGRPARSTRALADREAPFVVLDDDVLRGRLVDEALRLGAAVERLRARGPDAGVPFAGRTMTVAALDLHGRSECAVHRWDLVGTDDASRELLAQPDLTAHAVTVLSTMVDGSAESVASRAGALVAPVRAAFASPGQPDVVLETGDGGTVARLELAEPCRAPAATADAATRLLALWGRRSCVGPITWDDDGPGCDALRALLAPR